MANAVMSDRQFVAERAANMTILDADGKPHGAAACVQHPLHSRV